MGRISRSFLFVPGNRPDRFDKAARSGSHEIIVDLEDAVPPGDKDLARDMVRKWLEGGRRAIVRINAADTPWHADDIQMLRLVPDARVMLPKSDISSTRQVVAALPGRGLIVLLETVGAYMSLTELASTPGVERIAFGSIDFAVDSGIADEEDSMVSIRTGIVLASRQAGLLAPIDGVSTELNDEAVILRGAMRSKKLGFGGKLCIHPRQIAAVNAAYQSTPAETVWARHVLEAFEASHGAVVVVDGKMVDKPVVELAKEILASDSKANPT